MNQESVLATIRERRNIISRQGIVNGIYRQLIEDGLQVLALCQYGGHRSAVVAENLLALDIPAIFLMGGLQGIFDNINNLEIYPKILDEINHTPNVVAILTDQEVIKYQNILARIPDHQVYLYLENAVQAFIH